MMMKRWKILISVVMTTKKKKIKDWNGKDEEVKGIYGITLLHFVSDRYIFAIGEVTNRLSSLVST